MCHSLRPLLPPPLCTPTLPVLQHTHAQRRSVVVLHGYVVVVAVVMATMQKQRAKLLPHTMLMYVCARGHSHISLELCVLTTSDLARLTTTTTTTIRTLTPLKSILQRFALAGCTPCATSAHSHTCTHLSLSQVARLRTQTPRPLLPRMRTQDKGKKCLVLDLDETLVHSSFKVREAREPLHTPSKKEATDVIGAHTANTKSRLCAPCGD